MMNSDVRQKGVLPAMKPDRPVVAVVVGVGVLGAFVAILAAIGVGVLT